MFKTRDGLVRIDIAEDLSEVIFPPADFSILNMPHDHEEAADLFTNLFNSPTSRHISLVFCRHKRGDRLRAMSNFDHIGNWNYLDSIHVWYEKASSSSNNGFLPVSEQGIVLYKGSVPDVKKTEWFSSDDTQYSNATTLWNVASQPNEGSTSTYYQKFCWEIPLLLTSMAAPIEHKRFIYGFPTNGDEESIFKFCKLYGFSIQLYVKTAKEASDLIERYKDIKV